MATIKIDLDPNYEGALTPFNVGTAVQKALAFGTDDYLEMYEGEDAFSAPLEDGAGNTFGFIHIR